MNIETANGFVGIKSIYCELTGKQIGWQTIVTDEQLKHGTTPAYFSFDVIGNFGVIKRKDDLLKLGTT